MHALDNLFAVVVEATQEHPQEAGVSKDTIWRLENGHSEAHPSTIRKLAKAFGVQPKELVRTGGGDG